jgi:hypothetical protein
MSYDEAGVGSEVHPPGGEGLESCGEASGRFRGSLLVTLPDKG